MSAVLKPYTPRPAPRVPHVPGETGLGAADRKGIPTTARGLKQRYVMASNRANSAKFIGWRALEQSWREDMGAIADRMAEIGVSVPVVKGGW